MSMAKGTDITRADDIAKIDGIVKADNVTETTKRADMTSNFNNQNTDITKFKQFPEHNPLLVVIYSPSQAKRRTIPKRIWISTLLSSKNCWAPSRSTP